MGHAKNVLLCKLGVSAKRMGSMSSMKLIFVANRFAGNGGERTRGNSVQGLRGQGLWEALRRAELRRMSGFFQAVYPQVREVIDFSPDYMQYP